MEKKYFWKTSSLPYSIFFSFLATLAAKKYKSSLTSLCHNFFGFDPLFLKNCVLFKSKSRAVSAGYVDPVTPPGLSGACINNSLRCSFFSFVFYGIAANGSERAAPFPEQSSAVFSKNVYEKTVNDARITRVIHKCALRFLRDFLKRKSDRVLRNSVWYNSVSMVKYL